MEALSSNCSVLQSCQCIDNVSVSILHVIAGASKKYTDLVKPSDKNKA